MPELEIIADRHDDNRAFDLGRTYYREGLGPNAAAEDAAEAFGNTNGVRHAAREGWFAAREEEEEALEGLYDYGPDDITESNYGL